MKEDLSNLFEQGFLRTFPERSDRENAHIFEAAPFASKKRTTGKRKAG